MASSAETIIGYAENIAKIDRTSIGLSGLEETMLLNVLNKANREYFNKFLLGGGEPKESFKLETGGTLIADTALAEDITTATTDFDVDSATSYPSSGALIVWDNNDPDYVAYTGKSSNNLTGVTGIGYSHEDNDAVSALYALPTNFASFRSTDDSPDGVSVNGVPFTFVTGVPIGGQFATYDNGTTKYLHFPRGLTGDYAVKYNQGATSITLTSTSVDVPVDDEDFLVYRLAEYIFRVLGTDPMKMQEARGTANKILLDALKRRNVGKRPKHGRSFGGTRLGYPPSEAIGQL